MQTVHLWDDAVRKICSVEREPNIDQLAAAPSLVPEAQDLDHIIVNSRRGRRRQSDYGHAFKVFPQSAEALVRRTEVMPPFAVLRGKANGKKGRKEGMNEKNGG